MLELVEPELTRFQKLKASRSLTTDHNVLIAITLRYLAGASYLDLGCPYGIAGSTVYMFVGQTLEAIDRRLDHIKFPQTQSKCEAHSPHVIPKGNCGF